jgi:mxaL protein
MTVFRNRDLSFWLLFTALFLSCLAFVLPNVTRHRDVYDAVAVLDITGSMNTRDMEGPGGIAQSRLASARAALEKLAGSLPCQSRLGLGLFTERRSFLLFEPVSICSNYNAVTEAFSKIDWRMAWEADSYIAKGLYSAIDLAASLKSDVIFLTDGQEAPPLPPSGLPAFDGKPGEVSGLIVGVGADAKSPIPKFDGEGREVGVYGPQDVPQDNRFGLPPAGAELLPGYNPRNAPFGAESAGGDEHLSSLREEYLRKLASVTGLGFVRLAANPDLVAAVRGSLKKRSVSAASDIGVYPAGLALVLLVLLYGLPPLFNMAALGRALSLPARMKGAFR